MSHAGFCGLLTKYYIRVGLLTGDNETERKPARHITQDR
jgi:hypothetical protein